MEFSFATHPGALFTAANASIDTLIAGSPSPWLFNVNGTPGPVTGSAPTLTRNSGCWANGTLGLSALAVASGTSYTPYGYTAIAPDMILGAVHTGLPAAGSTFGFVKEDGSNTLVTATTTGSAQTVAGNIDLFVCRLTANLPAGVRSLKVPPANFGNYLTHLERQIAVFQCNQNCRASVTDWDGQPSIVHTTQPPAGTQRRTYYTAMQTGDSGHPTCIILNGELVLLGCLYFTNQALGNTWSNISAINAAIAATGSSSILTTFNLASFGP